MPITTGRVVGVVLASYIYYLCLFLTIYRAMLTHSCRWRDPTYYYRSVSAMYANHYWKSCRCCLSFVHLLFVLVPNNIQSDVDALVSLARSYLLLQICERYVCQSLLEEL